jgi:hypothetical protein
MREAGTPVVIKTVVKLPKIGMKGSLTDATIFVMADDQERPEDQQDVDDPFDRHVGKVLDEEAELLREQSDLLIATGSISLQRPTGVLTGHLRPPSWRRRGELEVRTVAAGSSGSARIPLSHAEYRDHARLHSEIRLQLAVQLAWLEEQ